MAARGTMDRLGDRLLRTGLISESQLNLALKEQKRVQEPLGRILLNLGFITEVDLAKALADQLGIPFMPLKSLDIDTHLVKTVPRQLALQHLFIPIRYEGDGTVTVAMANPANVIAVDAIQEFFGAHINIVASLESEISAGISMMTEWDSEDEEFQDLNAAAGSHMLIIEEEGQSYLEIVDRIIEYALQNQATDIHIEPEIQLLRLRYRIDGILHSARNLPAEMTSPVLTRIKIMAGLNITERRLPQDGRITYEYNNRKVDLRVSVMPTSNGENIVVRVLDRSSVSLNLGELGISPAMREELEKMVNRPYGMILISGPTGSGKTTTLYSLLLVLDSLSKKIVTIEDPIEYALPLIRQSQVDPTIEYSFPEGLRTILRQDPDVILVGEVRDRETADTAMRASLTGHVVLSSLHTNTALGAIPRLLDIGIEPILITSSLSGVIAQRLVRRICSECKEACQPTEEEARWLGVEAEGAVIYKPRGCPRCRNTGYVKRTGLFELFKMDRDFARLISKAPGEKELEEVAFEKGASFMVDDGKKKVLEGITTIQEVLRVCQNL